MEIKWIIAIIAVCALAFILYLVKRNQKDKDEVVTFLNETEVEDRPQPKENEED